jgi:hypothetical protein
MGYGASNRSDARAGPNRFLGKLSWAFLTAPLGVGSNPHRSPLRPAGVAPSAAPSAMGRLLAAKPGSRQCLQSFCFFGLCAVALLDREQVRLAWRGVR